jgi:small conductance mechanosensitive channel
MMDWSVFFANLLQALFNFLPKLIVAILVFIATLFLASYFGKRLYRALKRRDTKEELALLFSRLLRWSIWVGGTIWALSIVGFNVTAFIAGLGMTGLVIGFALQDISKNFTAGALLMLQEPFSFGDFVEVAGQEGTVVDIQLRATELIAPDGVRVMIPNADVFSNKIRNFTQTGKRRVSLTVGVAYGSDLEKVTRVALKAIHAVPGLLDDPEPVLFFHHFGDSAIEFTIRYWFDTAEADIFQAQDMGVKAIKAAFEAEGIDIPFPIRTVMLQGGPQQPSGIA